jgi:hypothetical protein
MSTLARRSGRKGSSFLLFQNKSYILLYWGSRAAPLRDAGKLVLHCRPRELTMAGLAGHRE